MACAQTGKEKNCQPFYHLIRQGCHGQGKKSGKGKCLQVREKSGNYIFSQGNLEKMKKVREFKNFLKKLLVNRLLDFFLHKLQAVL